MAATSWGSLKPQWHRCLVKRRSGLRAMLEMRCGAMWKEDEIGWLINHVGSIIFSTINREDGFSRLIHMMKKILPKNASLITYHLSIQSWHRRCAEIMRRAGEVHNDVDEVGQFQNVSDIQQNEPQSERSLWFHAEGVDGAGTWELLQGQWAVERDWADSSPGKRLLWVCIKSCRAEEIGTFPTLRFSLHEYFPTRPGPQSKFRLCILYEHWLNMIKL